MDFSGASLRLSDEGGAKLLALLDQIDKRAQDVAARMSKALNDAIGGAGKLPSLDPSSSPLGRIPKDAAEAEGSLLHMSHSSAIGLGELGRALARMAQSGQAGAFAMREFTGAAMRLAPGGVIAGVGVIAVMAAVEVWQAWQKTIEDTTDKLKELTSQHAALDAQLSGNKLGAEALKLQIEYEKQLKDIEKERFGIVSRTLAAMAAGFGFTGPLLSAERTDKRVDQSKREAKVARDKAGAKLLQDFNDRNTVALANAQLESAETPVEKYRAQLKVIAAERERAIHEGEMSVAAINTQAVAKQSRALADFQKAVFENAAKFAADDLDKNDSIIRRLTPAWTALWEKFAAQMEFGSETRKMAKAVSDATIRPILEETDANLKSSIAFAMGNFKQFEKAAPLFSDEFWQDFKGEIQQKATQATNELAKWMQQQIGQTLGDAIHNGFLRAFQSGGNIGSGIKALLGTLLQGLGAMFVTLGESMLPALISLAAIKNAIALFMPEASIAAAIGLIALGTAMEAGGGAIASGGGGGGSYGGGGYSGGGGTIVDRGTINPMAPAGPVTSPSNIQARPTMVFNLVGTRDPVLVRQIQEIVKYGKARGNA